MKEEKVKVREMGTHETSWDIMGFFPVELEVGQLFDFLYTTETKLKSSTCFWKLGVTLFFPVFLIA